MTTPGFQVDLQKSNEKNKFYFLSKRTCADKGINIAEGNYHTTKLIEVYEEILNYISN